MQIVCVMVTEGRAKIARIAFASFMAQTYPHRSLRVHCPQEENAAYQAASESCLLRTTDENVPHRCNNVPNDLDRACSDIFLKTGADAVCIWDDDDYSPPDRLERTVSALGAFHPRPVVASYDRGYFVNLRSLRGSLVKVDHLWGGCLAFNREAYFRGGGFDNLPCPGYDRQFVETVRIAGGKTVVIEAPDDRLPVAFIHGKNIATQPQAGATGLEEQLREWMPQFVFEEVKALQQYCIERRIFPPEGD